MSEWGEYKLGEVAEKITKGTTPTTLGLKYTNNGINFVKSESFGYDGKLDKAKFAFIDERTHSKLFRSQLKEDDILFSMAGVYLGKTALVTEDILPANTNQAVGIIRIAKDKAFPKYVRQYLSQTAIIELINNFSGQSAQPNINLEEIGSIPVFLPPLPEQRSIAGVLSSLDDKIDLLHRQNKTLEGMAEALWWNTFVEEADPGWQRGKLGDLLTSIEAGRRPKGGIDPNLSVGVPSIGAESINGLGNYDFSKTKYVTEEYYAQMNSGKIQNHDILIYKDGAYIGKKSMFANGFPFEKCCINEHVFILRAGKLNSQLFLYFILEQEELEQLNANSAQPGLNQEALKSFEIIIPNDDSIDEYGIKAKPMIDKIFANSVQIRTLSRLRDTLLPKLMSGEVRVRDE